MSTRSIICAETLNGDNVGVYCHYDGYPDNMLPILKEMSHDKVADMIADGIKNGGLRMIKSSSCYETFQEPGEDMSGSFSEVGEMGTEYAYLKKLDGTIITASKDAESV